MVWPIATSSQWPLTSFLLLWSVKSPFHRRNWTLTFRAHMVMRGNLSLVTSLKKWLYLSALCYFATKPHPIQLNTKFFWKFGTCSLSISRNLFETNAEVSSMASILHRRWMNSVDSLACYIFSLLRKCVRPGFGLFLEGHWVCSILLLDLMEITGPLAKHHLTWTC